MHEILLYSIPLASSGTAASDMLSTNLSILQAFRFADSDEDHVKRLLHWAELPVGAEVVDLGAGSGYVAARMVADRPDLSICMVDSNQDLLESAYGRFRKHCADICNVPEPDKTFDGATCCYAIGYVDAHSFFKEVHRLVRPGGVVFIVDMVPASSTVEATSLFGYTIRSHALIEQCAKSAGLSLDFYMEPRDHSNWGAAQFPWYFTMLFGDLRPAIWRFRV